jgi:hypothetical protein
LPELSQSFDSPAGFAATFLGFAFGPGFAFAFFGEAFLAAAFFGAAFLAAGFFVIFFAAVVDALFGAAADSWIRRVVKNVRRVAANAGEVNTEEDAA